ncbi:hypothetical protein HYU19_04685 [Candidatus Woesearchaeota archaeon]|nr:hypothetical protein [Candidatus Woesearchaeota archaeon]
MLNYIPIAKRMLERKKGVLANGFHQYDGDTVEICRDILDDCWTGTHLKASNGHFQDFWTRDFCFCVRSLLKIKNKDRVIQTLKYAIGVFEQHGVVTTTISSEGMPSDFPQESADSLPLLVRAIRLADPGLMQQHEQFFLDQIQAYYDRVFDPVASMVTTRRFFSSIKDLTLRYSSTYDNCMLAMLKDDLEAMGFFNPFKEYDIRSAIMENLWNGDYFYEDTRKKPIVTGDANVFPFWTGVVHSREMFASCLRQIQKARLDIPFPLKYSSEKETISNTVWFEPLAGRYERNAIWMHLGLCFLEVVQKYHDFFFREYLKKYTALIEQHKTMLEVFDPDGKPLQERFYITDEAMSWAAMYLGLVR